MASCIEMPWTSFGGRGLLKWFKMVSNETYTSSGHELRFFGRAKLPLSRVDQRPAVRQEPRPPSICGRAEYRKENNP